MMDDDDDDDDEVVDLILFGGECVQASGSKVLVLWLFESSEQWSNC